MEVCAMKLRTVLYDNISCDISLEFLSELILMISMLRKIFSRQHFEIVF